LLRLADFRPDSQLDLTRQLRRPRQPAAESSDAQDNSAIVRCHSTAALFRIAAARPESRGHPQYCNRGSTM